jgi:leucyl aminopeptidase (aminopeptidase T)
MIYNSTTLLLGFNSVVVPMKIAELKESAMHFEVDVVNQHCRRLANLLDKADFARISFSNGDLMDLDLRFRQARIDNGKRKPRDDQHLISMAFGELPKARMEDRPSITSRSNGILPLIWHNNEIIRLVIRNNAVVEVLGFSKATQQFCEQLSFDPSRRNIAELGFVWSSLEVPSKGRMIEVPKAASHISLGRADAVAASALSPAAWQHTFVYELGSLVWMQVLTLHFADGSVRPLIYGGSYVRELELGVAA